jgi:hypothetical protein
MNATAELCLWETILPELEQGRPDWDRPHTETVVAYIQDIVAAEPDLGLDSEVLTIAGYAHDWGYTGLFRDGHPVNPSAVVAMKAAHMLLGAEKLGTLLERPEFDYLSQEQKGRAGHLVFMHDMVEDLEDPDELVLMEADTLAAFDPAVASIYSLEDKKAWMAKATERRVSRFITAYSKRKVVELAVANPAHVDYGLMQRLAGLAGDGFLLAEAA